MNEKGFTLLEALIVLSIVSITILVMGKMIVPLSEKILTTKILNQVKEDIYYAQARSISKEELVWVQFDVINDLYLVQSKNFFIQRKLPKYVDIQFSNLGILNFYLNGNASQSGQVQFKIFDKKYRLVVLLGMGRIYVEQF